MNWSSILRVVVVSSLLISSAGVAVTPVAAAPAVQVSSVTVTPDDPITGERVTVDATISNLENSDSTVRITDIYVRDPESITEYARVEDLGSVAPGGSVTVPVSTTFETPGQKRLTVNVAVRYDGGAYERYTYPVYIDVETPNVKADLSASGQANGTGTRVTLTNYGNTNLTDVALTADADGDRLDRNYVFDVAPGASQSTVFDTDDVAADRLTVTARYDAAGDSHTTALDVDLNEEAPVLGEVRLTGIEATSTGSGLRLQGDAANLGTTDAESVLLRIPDTEAVSPTSPAGEYFVGAVEGSEFATFELTAATAGNVSSVPVEITYIVDDERVTTTQRLQVDPAPAMSLGAGQAPGGGGSSGGPPGGSNGPPLTLIGGAVAVVVVAGAVLYRWRR